MQCTSTTHTTISLPRLSQFPFAVKASDGHTNRWTACYECMDVVDIQDDLPETLLFVHFPVEIKYNSHASRVVQKTSTLQHRCTKAVKEQSTRWILVEPIALRLRRANFVTHLYTVVKHMPHIISCRRRHRPPPLLWQLQHPHDYQRIKPHIHLNSARRLPTRPPKSRLRREF